MPVPSVQIERPVAERPFIVFGKPDITDFEIEAISSVLRSGWIGTGKVAAKFEQRIAEFLGGGHAVATNSCTMALVLALRAAGVDRGDEVITTPMSFAATVNAILMLGARPVFIDVTSSGCLNSFEIFDAITDSTAAIIPVHYTGAPCDMAEIMEIADTARLTVIEDAAHGFGGEYRGRKLGSLGHFGCLSFHAVKNITCGDGGMVFTQRGDQAEKIRILSRQGQSSGAWNRFTSSPVMPYEVLYSGYKASMPDLLAALGLAQLARWDEISKKRSAIFTTYERAFGVKEPGHSQHLFTLRVKNRDQVRQKLHKQGIGTGIHYTPLHLEPAYEFLGYQKGDFPNAEKIGEETISLPVSATMSVEDAERVVAAVKAIIETGET